MFRPILVLVLVVAAGVTGHTQSSTYGQLLTLFEEWRRFEEPPRLAGGVPDYRPATSAARLNGLRALQKRLASIDRSGWTVPQQVDHHIVRAEMNGLEYHLRVLQPFARDPAYYASIITDESDTPAKEGPVIHGAIRLFDYPIWPRTGLDTVQPLSTAQARELATRLVSVPPLLQAARTNLAAGNARDLWVGAVRAFEEQAEALDTLRDRVGNSHEGPPQPPPAAARGRRDARGLPGASGTRHRPLSEMGGRRTHADGRAVDGTRAPGTRAAVHARSDAQLLHAGHAA
jgi:hypothetical protein